MKRIVSSDEMRNCDKNTIEYFGVPSLVLMERAALSVVSHILKERPQCGRVLVVCGNGNNGADGLAAARLLYQEGIDVHVFHLPDNGKRSQENKLQRRIIDRYGIKAVDDIPIDAAYDCIIDALFGVGLSRPPKQEYAGWILKMNRLHGFKAAIDMPSGVSADTGEVYEAAVKADLTVTFAYQKMGQILYPGRENCGKTVVAQIGITDESWLLRRPLCYAPEKEDLKMLPQRPARSNKGTFGKILVIAGSRDMAGAALFCAKAAYCMGCGLVKICTPQENRIIIQSTLPEAVLMTYDSSAAADGEALLEELQKAADWADVILLGPGTGTGSLACRITKWILSYAKAPIVLDADGINIAAKEPALLTSVHSDLIITPHLGEMARLCGKQISDIQSCLVETARETAAQYQLTCVLKDAVSVTAAADGTVYLNTSGCNAMAKGGSGDVLSGILAALLAQGMPAEKAAFLGVYVHGLAGEAAAKKKGPYSVLARDIIDAAGWVLARACQKMEVFGRRESKKIDEVSV